jgi:hypothetical protein
MLWKLGPNKFGAGEGMANIQAITVIKSSQEL